MDSPFMLEMMTMRPTIPESIESVLAPAPPLAENLYHYASDDGREPKSETGPDRLPVGFSLEEFERQTAQTRRKYTRKNRPEQFQVPKKGLRDSQKKADFLRFVERVNARLRRVRTNPTSATCAKIEGWLALQQALVEDGRTHNEYIAQHLPTIQKKFEPVLSTFRRAQVFVDQLPASIAIDKHSNVLSFVEEPCKRARDE